MSYDDGALRASLAAAVGDDPALVAELGAAFLASAASLADVLGRARCEADWRAAAWRLRGLAASFGATALMEVAAEAARGAPADPVMVQRINAVIVALEG